MKNECIYFDKRGEKAEERLKRAKKRHDEKA